MYAASAVICCLRAGRIHLAHMPASRPGKAELRAVMNKTVPDVIAPGLRVLFCGINPGLYSAATRHHFARPGNRFWATLYASGFTARLLTPAQERELLSSGLGITNIVARASARADELTTEELASGARALRRKVKYYSPTYLAVLGISAYRSAFGQPHAGLGRQQLSIGSATIWVLPNPSGLNAHYQLHDLAQLFTELRQAAQLTGEKPCY